MARLTNEHLHNEIVELKHDVREIKKRLLDPDDGTISRVNNNTTFRKNTRKTLWSIWIALLGIIAKLVFWD